MAAHFPPESVLILGQNTQLGSERYASSLRRVALREAERLTHSGHQHTLRERVQERLYLQICKNRVFISQTVSEKLSCTSVHERSCSALLFVLKAFILRLSALPQGRKATGKMSLYAHSLLLTCPTGRIPIFTTNRWPAVSDPGAGLTFSLAVPPA